MPNFSITAPPVSRPVAPTGVYDVDQLRLQCRAIGIIPNRPNLRRCRRAIDLLNHGGVIYRLQDQDFDFYWVESQTYPDLVYSVRVDRHFCTECDCPDASNVNRCTHQIAVILYIAAHN